MPAKTPSLKCPTCGSAADFNAPPVGMFCSERCRLIDLGKWLGEDYRISEPLRPDHFDEAGDPGSGSGKGRTETRD